MLNKSAIVALTALLVFLILVGAAVAFRSSGKALRRDEQHQIVPIAFAPVVGPAQTAIPPSTSLLQVLKNFDGDAVVSAHVGSPPPGAQRGNLPWLYATVRLAGLKQGLDIEPLWQADLIEGAIAERAGTSADIGDDFGGSTFDAVLPDGSTVPDLSGGIGDVARGQHFDAGPPSQIQGSILRTLKNFGLDSISVKIEHGLGPAPAVIASTSDVRTAAGQFVALGKALFGDPAAYEGYYLELRDSQGTPWIRASASFRTGAGRFWVDPQWADLVGEKTSLSAEIG